MSIELLRQNIERELSIARELFSLNKKHEFLESSSESKEIDREEKLLNDSIGALISQVKIINNAIPEIIRNINFYPSDSEQPGSKFNKELLNISYNDSSKENKEANIAISKKEEKKFLESLAIHNYSSSKMNAAKIKKKESKEMDFSGYAKISNKFFRKYSDKLIEKGNFASIKSDLRKVTSLFTANSYISMMFFSVVVSFILAIVIAVVLFILDFPLLFSVIAFFLIPLITFGLFFIYPSSRRKSLETEINREIPFLTIYMAAISTSGIEPSRIFDIIVSSDDYPFIGREIRKLTNFVNFFGYDLVSALKTVARNNPSEKLSQLFEGLSTTITSGGALADFLSKHSDSLLFDYRLEREKATQITETLMNIYISVVIAAPMILMVLFVLMSLTSMGGWLSPTLIGVLTSGIIGLVNVGFLVLLNLKQPRF